MHTYIRTHTYIHIHTYTYMAYRHTSMDEWTNGCNDGEREIERERERERERVIIVPK